MRSLFLAVSLAAALFGYVGSSMAQIDGPLIASPRPPSSHPCLFAVQIDARTSKLDRVPSRRSSMHGGKSSQIDLGCTDAQGGRFHGGVELHVDLYMDSKRPPFAREGGDVAAGYVGYEFWTPLVNLNTRAKMLAFPPLQLNKPVQVTVNASRPLYIGPLTVTPWLELNHFFWLRDIQDLTFVDYGLRTEVPLRIAMRYLKDVTLIADLGAIHNVTPFAGRAARFVEPSLSRTVTKYFDVSLDWDMFSLGAWGKLGSRLTYRYRIDDHDGAGILGLRHVIGF